VRYESYKLRFEVLPPLEFVKLNTSCKQPCRIKEYEDYVAYYKVYQSILEKYIT
jgi:hypothetical protein